MQLPVALASWGRNDQFVYDLSNPRLELHNSDRSLAIKVGLHGARNGRRVAVDRYLDFFARDSFDPPRSVNHPFYLRPHGNSRTWRLRPNSKRQTSLKRGPLLRGAANSTSAKSTTKASAETAATQATA